MEQTTTKKQRQPRKQSSPFSKLVNPVYFAEATRESGYKTTCHALAELVDNSIQARATRIAIHFEDKGKSADDIWVHILDNGSGMDAETLAVSLQFGGSTRFNSREGIGRFGMGLPNASVSQCRRIEVYTRKAGEAVLYTYLDLDEVAEGITVDGLFLTPVSLKDWQLPAIFSQVPFDQGTLVIWKKCDRLNPRNIDGLRKKVTGHLGQVFRNFIYLVEEHGGSRTLTVNGSEVRPFDPLYLDPRAEWTGAEERGLSHYDIPVPGKKTEKSRVTVKYSILPIEEWQNLPTKDKVARRIMANKGFSVVRAGREIEVTDRYFLVGVNGQEGRITNNDAWWSCEICFDAKLDEVFGVTHTKQEIRPNTDVLQKMRDDITATISTLRSEYEQLRAKKSPNQTHTSEEIAARSDQFLPPTPEVKQKPEEFRHSLDEYLVKTNREGETKEDARRRALNKPFSIELESAKEGPFYRTAYLGQNMIVYVNTDHPFYSEVYARLDDNPNAQVAIELWLFALAWGERSSGPDGRMWYQSQRSGWSAALRAYLNQ